MPERPSAARLVVVQGDASRRELEIGAPVELGRGDTCDLVLLDGSASRRHARIEPRGADYYIVDLGSTNGVFVNSTKVREGRLNDGDEVALGGVRLRFRAPIPGETMVVGSPPARPAPTRRAEKAFESKGSAAGAELPEGSPPKTPMGRNAQFLGVRAVAERAAMSSLPILLRGETGTGKEVFAHYIHSRSDRASGPFVALHAAAIPRELFEAELFGSERGAFTGATERREGYLAMAGGGTLFLDEVGELPMEAQIKLLRVLETGEFHSVGSSATRRSNFRLIAATNRNLECAVREGGFRADLLFRLNAVELKLPPLRERPDDIALFTEAFLNPLGKRPGDGLVDALTARRFPGNVRELRNMLERAAMFADGDVVLPAHLPPEAAIEVVAAHAPPPRRDETTISALTLDNAERLAIERALRKTGGRRGDAAKLLGIAEPTLRRKIRRYGLETQDGTGPGSADPEQGGDDS